MKNIFLVILIALLSCNIVSAPNKYVIGTWPGGGLAICIISVLQHIAHCEATNKVPVVYWGTQSFYYHPNGFNGAKDNVWEYYFEPISDLKYAGEVAHGYSGGVGSGQFNAINLDNHLLRDHAHRLYVKYIRPKQNIQTKVGQFYKENIEGKHTVGIHLRGTDVLPDIVGMKMQRIADEALKHAHEDSQFFITSDDWGLFKQLIPLLKEHKIIEYPCYRSDDGAPLHRAFKPSRAQVGEDVLVEMLLLAQCDYLVLMQSNVSSVPIIINNKVGFTYFMHNQLKGLADKSIMELD